MITSVCVALALAASGYYSTLPIVKVDPKQIRPRVEKLPPLADLNHWLKVREEKDAPNLKDERLRKQVLWADSENPQPTEGVLLYLHGFSASNREMSPVIEQVANNLKMNLYLPRLKGHGTRNFKDLGLAKPEEWFADAIESLFIAKELGKKVYVVGTSMGGALATWLANHPEYSQHIAEVILISPLYQLKDSMANRLNTRALYLLARLAKGKNIRWEATNDEQKKLWEELNIVWTNPRPLHAIASSVAVMHFVQSTRYANIQTPTLFLYNPADAVVNVEAIRKAFLEWPSGNKQITEIEADDHVLAGELTSPRTISRVQTEIETFLNRVK